MDGNSVHAYKLVNARGEVHYVKFHWKSLQGQKNLDPKQVAEVQGRDYSHMTNDLVSAIRKGDFPKWDLYIQVLKPEDLAKFDFDPLDATKIWPGIPERKIGQMVLNRNVDNFFQETEQVAMAPSNLVPGIEPSEDRLLQDGCSPTPIPRCTGSAPTAWACRSTARAARSIPSTRTAR